MNILQKLLSDDSGATAIEYGLIAALIAIVLVGALKTVGANLKNTFNTVATSL
jgi:pilus assembly protein Flp/PilA